MSSELIVMTFRRQDRAETVLEAIRSMRKSPILCLGSVVVAIKDSAGEITLRPAQEPAADGDDRDTKILLDLVGLMLRVPAKDATDAIMDGALDRRFISGVVTSMEGESSALFVLAYEDGVHDAGETRSTLALFRGRIHQTSLSLEVEAFLSEGWASKFVGKGERNE
jgi:uncharacterized membrane protein